MGGPVRPSGYIGWGSTGATNVNEPTDAKKAVGFSISEKPSSAYFNWLLQKQDQWIQYLDWRQQAFTVVEENSLPNPGPYGVTGSTAGGSINIGPWQYFTPSQVNVFAVNGSNWDVVNFAEADNNSPLGRQFFAQGSGYAHILAGVGNIGHARDFRMDHVAMMSTRRANTLLELGLMLNHSGFSGGNPIVGWLATGTTGQVFAQWIPSGKTPTSFACPSAYQQPGGLNWIYPVKFTVEARGPTMAFFANDILQGAVAAVPLGVTSLAPLCFGTRAGGNSGTIIVQSFSMRFQTVRTPF